MDARIGYSTASRSAARTVGTDNAISNIYVTNSDHPTFRRLLVHHNDRYQNGHLMEWNFVNSSLVEESEFYYFHRHGMMNHNGDSNVFRRNYFNSRGYADLPDGRYSDPTYTGDVGITTYPATNSIIENNIGEGNSSTFDIQPDYGDAINNRYYGNISRDEGAFFAQARGNTLNRMARNTYFENLVSVPASSANAYSFYVRDTKNTHCVNCSFLGALYGGLADTQPGYAGDGAPTTYFTNVLSINHATAGFDISGQTDWAIDYSNAWSNATNYSPYDSHVTNSISIDPKMGTCKVLVPDNSPMKRAGKNGADIGANVLYRYQDGVLTTQPLWDPVTGRFPCGALVPGLNDVPGQSCFDVHQRLNVNTNGCPFPQGYGGTTLRGDLNGDDKRDLVDVRLLIYMLIGQQAKTPEADLTGDGAVTLADVQALIRLLVGIP